MKSLALILLGLLTILNRVKGIAEPKHKVILKQNGYPQYIHFVTSSRPAMSEFTFCIWLRATKLDREQIIFFYKVQRILDVALWLDIGGKTLIVSINDQVWKNPVNLRLRYWQHFCISYQSYFGAMALYIGGRLTSCTVNKLLAGYVIPGGGNFVIGHGSKENGIPYGLEGEVFGFNMLLKSTIKVPPKFKSDKIRDKQVNTDSYKPKDLETSDEQIQGQNNIDNIISMAKNWNSKQDFKPMNRSGNYRQADNMGSVDDLDTSINTRGNKNDLDTIETFESMESTPNVSKPHIVSDSETTNTALSKSEFKMLHKNPRIKAKISRLHTANKELHDLEAEDLSSISEYEEPPPVDAPNDYVSIEQLNVSKPPPIANEDVANEANLPVDTIPEVEVPPPIQTNNKVYGQWTSSMYASRVFNYLNKLNIKHRDQTGVPQTIPLQKVSDEYPYYRSDNSMAKSPFEVGPNLYLSKRWKRNTETRQINVKILENDFRSEILKEHAKNRPQKVEITNRGESYKEVDSRFFRNLHDIPLDVFENHDKKNSINDDPNSHRTLNHLNISSSQHLIHELPVGQTSRQNEKSPGQQNKDNSNSMYINSLINNNWHNVKSYNKQINPPLTTNMNLETKKKSEISVNPKNYNGDNFIIDFNNKLYSNYDTGSQINAGPRRIIKAVSSNYTGIESKKKKKFKYRSFGETEQETEFLKESGPITPPIDAHPTAIIPPTSNTAVFNNNKFLDFEEHGSQVEEMLSHPPASLNIKVCDSNDFMHGTMLYVKTDGNIVTNYVRTIAKNLGVAFVAKNYLRCSASFPSNPMIVINWSTTRIRLFGGAVHKPATGLCGIV